MLTVILNESARYTIVHALRVAGTYYRETAEAIRVDHPDVPSLVRQFMTQSEEVFRLADRLEHATDGETVSREE